MGEVIKLEKGISLVRHNNYFSVDYGGEELSTVDIIFDEESHISDAKDDAERFFNGVLLGIRLVETYGLEIFKAVEKVVTDGQEQKTGNNWTI